MTEFSINSGLTSQNLHLRISTDISHITQSYCLNNFNTVHDNSKLQIRLHFVLKLDVKLILSLIATITFTLSNIHFIQIFTILEQ